MIYGLLLHALNKAVGGRSDGMPYFQYFDESEYGISAKPFSFYSGKNLLRGKKYFLEWKEDQPILIFFHGLGAGASSYTQEIAYFVKRGFLVYAYDNTGCMTSEGRQTGFLPQSLLDQKAFFDFLDHDEDAQGRKRYAMGHSWGGYTAFGGLFEEYHLEKIVSISGFINVCDIVTSRIPILKKFMFLLRGALKKGFGRFGTIDFVKLLENTDKHVMYIQGENDVVVPKKDNYDVLQQRLMNKKNIQLVLVPKANHNPYWTIGTQHYFQDVIRNNKLNQLGFNNHALVEYGKICDDPKIMEQIETFLKS